MSYAYDIDRGELFTNLRKEASESYRGMTAIVSGKPYLVINKEDLVFVLEGEDGSQLKMEGGFDHYARTKGNALIAASRVNSPFIPGSKLGDWEIGKLAYVNGEWYVRHADTEKTVPVNELVQMMEDEGWNIDSFLSNFKIHNSSDSALEDYMPELATESAWYSTELPDTPFEYSLDTMSVESGLFDRYPRRWDDRLWPNPWGNRGEIGDPRYDRGSYLTDTRERTQEEEAQRQLAPHTWQKNVPESEQDVHTPGIRTNPRPWRRREIEREQMDQIQSEIDAGLRPEKPPFLSEEQWSMYLQNYKNQPLTPYEGARSDYDHWNEEADRMWWEEEGRHEDFQEPYDDYNNRMDNQREDLEEAAEEGYSAAQDIPPDVLESPYDNYEATFAYLNGYMIGREDQGYDSLTPEEYRRILGRVAGPNLTGIVSDSTGKVIGQFIRELDNGNWLLYTGEGSREVNPEGLTVGKFTSVKKAELVRDIPYQEENMQDVVHAYEDGDIVLLDGTTTFDPERAYGWLLGQKEFDAAAKVKLFIDRSPPQELPDSVIPPEEAMTPQTELPNASPEEAPLDPSGGQAPVQPPTEVPPAPESFMGADQRSQRSFLPPQSSSVNNNIEFFEREARKNFSLSEQKDLINENLDGKARNIDKLNLEGTHYELEQESSLDDFLWI